ncbi:hypothetical protein KIH74_04650 [Kineosporia sp. J2-2]|uniref:Carboxypeptidase regulatory-like domain-containing protein n=1 Tax=Kineosporia corallincola TaxID=2835133 RepID=A0ABS5TAV5_9ACTN|nr:hypothetical protein [Kineosporia corallincola]MBT0768199.1 hypothetical protein [Kineosporia corallincola]
MDVSLVNDEISLEPDVPTELLVDVVNTADVIDAVHIDLAGAPGAVAELDGTPTLFPGERRRLPLRVRLPARMPAGRHELAVRVRPAVGDTCREAGLTVDVGPKPAMVAGIQPSVRKAGRRTRFPLTVANRGNTALLVQPRAVEVPDGVEIRFEPDEFIIEPWNTGTAVIRVSGPRNLVGAVLEHPLDLRVTAWSSTPGHPLLQQELRHDLKITFRQKAVFSTWLLFGIALVLMLALWIVLGYVGVQMFVKSSASPMNLSPAMLGPTRLDGGSDPDVSISVSGRVIAQDGRSLAGVTVLACDAEDPRLLRGRRVRYLPTQLPRCARQPAGRKGEEPAPPGLAWAVEQDVSSSDGSWLIENILPGRYWLYFDSPDTADLITAAYWYTGSCQMVRGMPGRPGELTVQVRRWMRGASQERLPRVRVQVLEDTADDEGASADEGAAADGDTSGGEAASGSAGASGGEGSLGSGGVSGSGGTTGSRDAGPAPGAGPQPGISTTAVETVPGCENAALRNDPPPHDMTPPTDIPALPYRSVQKTSGRGVFSVQPVMLTDGWPDEGRGAGQSSGQAQSEGEGKNEGQGQGQGQDEGGTGGGALDGDGPDVVDEDETTARTAGGGLLSARVRIRVPDAPGRYDLKITFGKETMMLRDVEVLPGSASGVLSVRFSPVATTSGK